MTEKPSHRPRVLIVGAGFGGLAAAKRLAGQPVDVTIIDQRNYHLFQPLLYQVATAALSPADVAWPIRSIFPRSPNIRVILGKVEGIDLQKRESSPTVYPWVTIISFSQPVLTIPISVTTNGLGMRPD